MKRTTDITIPPMVHPLSKAWEQPEHSEIKFAFGCAWVSEKTFKEFKNYSHSRPTAIYAGKMWRREYILKTKESIQTRHLLCWCVDSKKEGYCDIKEIELLIDTKVMKKILADG
jgi:hypothetical protein